MTLLLTMLIIYAILGLLWAIMILFEMHKMIKSVMDVFACVILNFLFWPISMSLFFAKRTGV